MKKMISILLAVMLMVSVAVVSAHAEYAPEDSYTVSADTPTAEEAIAAAGGTATIKIYFQAPESWYNKFNTLEGTDYGQICIYWWSGVGTTWPNGATVHWVGYKATLEDKENRIFSAHVPAAGTPLVLWNNGVNGGMDKDAEIYNYAAQVKDINIEGADEGDYDTIPEGADSFDGYISIPDPSRTSVNPLSGVEECETDWYCYYGNGCYGNYAPDSDNYHGRIANCVNPEHHHLVPGDVNNDKVVDIDDVTDIQRYLVGLEDFTADQKDAADVDSDNYVSIMDATRIQRYLAKICNLDGSKPYAEAE